MASTNFTRFVAGEREGRDDLVKRCTFELVEVVVGTFFGRIESVGFMTVKPAKPETLDVGQMAQEPEQAQRGRRNGATTKLLVAQAGALRQESRSIPVEHRVVHRRLIADKRRCCASDVRKLDHVTTIVTNSLMSGSFVVAVRELFELEGRVFEIKMTRETVLQLVQDLRCVAVLKTRIFDDDVRGERW